MPETLPAGRRYEPRRTVLIEERGTNSVPLRCVPLKSASDVTVHEILNSAVSRLREADVTEPRRSAEYLVQHVLGLSRAQLFAYGDTVVTAGMREQIDALLERRLAREPVQYILGYAHFFGRRFAVSPDVLIPRPETEELVELVLDRLPADRPTRVLDVGTGSGCIGITVALERSLARVTACDVSDEALAVARSNADQLGASVQMVRADLFDDTFATDIGGPFDLVVCNPPYVPKEEMADMQPEVVDHEPHLALFPGDDPLRFYRRLSLLAPLLLAEKGRMLVETPDPVLEVVTGYNYYGDLAGRIRFAEYSS